MTLSRAAGSGRRKDSPQATLAPKRRLIVTGGWEIALVVFGAVLAIGGQELHDWYYKPKLDIWFSGSVLLRSGRTHGSSVENFAVLADIQNRCSVGGWSFTGKKHALCPWDSTSRIFWKLFVYNSGRSPATEIRIGLDSDAVEAMEIETTPTINAEMSMTRSSTGFTAWVISIPQVPPETAGIITVRGKVLSNVSFDHDAGSGRFQARIADWGTAGGRLDFLGAKEIGQRADLHVMCTREMLQRESEMYGESTLRVPFIEISGMPIPGEQMFDMKYYDLSDRPCPNPPNAPELLTWKVQVQELPQGSSCP